MAAKLLLSLLALSPVLVASEPAPLVFLDPNLPVPGIDEGEHTFSLRHLLHHGTFRYPQMLKRLDVLPDTLVATEDTQTLRSRPTFKASSKVKKATRLQDRSKDVMETHLLNHRMGKFSTFGVDAWISEPVRQPNITDKATVVALSKVAADAYIEVQGTDDWLDVGTPYNVSKDFGWQDQGLRGHIFADETNSTVIIGLKGTSSAVFDGAETTTNDKINDNLLFSCCCARVSYLWTPVCDCYSGTAYTCNSVCLRDALMDEDRYYRAALQLYYNVTHMYPSAQVWVVGHSLGGALSSLIGQTYGIPAVAFEAPGEALASNRIGLPLPPGSSRQTDAIPVYHFGHTADPVFMGTCNGVGSLCSIGGYAMESRCHAGMECVYDTVGEKGWRIGLGYHRIQSVVRDVIEAWETVPECKFEPDCMDCFNWNFVTGNETKTTTTTKPTTTTTTTCKTPGWWGCRDLTITTSPTTTATITTTTCSSYGWFGNCLDPITTTAVISPTTITTPASTSAIPTPTSTITSTDTCSHRGWFGGCLDPETPSATPTPTTTPCLTPGRLWGCRDPVPETTTTLPTTTGEGSGEAQETGTPRRPGCDAYEMKCADRALWGFGWCRQWELVPSCDPLLSNEL
ncbi:alpha/beta-hydrolase [Ascodesmis nigricans]|uniref:triacylglycerol lipase n=1 Tax=Ascodesmis nigricans TaxID=341454 RepID=A0A4S2N1V7_9PEZI|nr:alpha/beta-hydrolase [Ascodesmis nigricans]